MKFSLFTMICLIFISCTATKKTSSDKNVKALLTMMTGTFNSEAQAIADSNYYNITLQMYPIWEDKEGNWLYVEQAVTAAQDRPYRQRVYKVSKEGNQFASAVYTLPNPKDYIGAWKTPEKFNAFSPEDLEIREGCTVYLTKTPKGNFSGATGKNSCGSTLRGASYATSQVTIEKDKIVSWDQGFDADGKQVWGATQGGYVFDRIE
ncbi:MAG: chromophore lyase CpcT/CpeT [Saprospiraceae bacterium]